MSRLGDAFRRHHQALLQQLERHVEAVQGPQASEQAAQLARFLQEELLPHARAEERHLYAAVEPLLHRAGRATATMSVDHEVLEGYVRQVAQTIQQLARAAGGGEGAAEPARHQLARLAVELAAVLRLHIQKEERVYLPLVEQGLSEGEQERLLEAMHQEQRPGAEGHPGVAATLDVRPLPPARRHPLIFDTFDRLAVGQALELVNDHDPRPLYYQFAVERSGEFGWEYLERGPESWRVRIVRTAPPGSAAPAEPDRTGQKG